MKGLRFGAVAVVVGMFGLAGCVVDGDTLDDLLDDENGGGAKIGGVPDHNGVIAPHFERKHLAGR